MIFLMCCWIRFAIILLRIFASVFIKELAYSFPFLVVSLSALGMSVILSS
jgi:hypothetical protein